LHVAVSAREASVIVRPRARRSANRAHAAGARGGGAAPAGDRPSRARALASDHRA